MERENLCFCHREEISMPYCSGLHCGRQQKHHVATPPPAGVRRRMERKRQKLMGQDKGSLIEQQTKGTGTTTIQIRGKHDTNCTTHRAVFADSTLRSHERVLAMPPPLTGIQHDGTWYGIPGSVWQVWGWVSPPGCAPSWILVKSNPVPAEPRTLTSAKQYLKRQYQHHQSLFKFFFMLFSLNVAYYYNPSPKPPIQHWISQLAFKTES